MHQHRYASSWFTFLALKDAFSTNVNKIYIEFLPSTYALHVENRILFVYEISS